MMQYLRFFGISAFLLFLVNGLLVQSVADPANPVVFSEKEKQYHIAKMRGMTEQEKNQYRSEQYQILRDKAAAIGYQMPDSPPWETDNSSDKEAFFAEPNRNDSRDKGQLAKYRKEAADKRQEIHQRLEQQRQSIKKRIADLVERHSVKPPTEAQAAEPVPPQAYQPSYQPGVQPSAPAYPYPPVAPSNPYNPGYPPYYRMPAPAYPGYY